MRASAVAARAAACLMRMSGAPWVAVCGGRHCPAAEFNRVGRLLFHGLDARSTSVRCESGRRRSGSDERSVIGSRMVLQLQSDARLVSLAREDAPGAFEAIVDRYRGPLVRHCTRLVGRDHAEDVVQQAFMKTYVFLRDDDRELLLRPWLYRVSRNLALNTLDRSDFGHDALEEEPEGRGDPVVVLEQREDLRRLVAGVRGLPERQREVLVARELEDREVDAIARDMAVSAPVVHQLLHRARATLRDAAGALVPLPALRAWLQVGYLAADAFSPGAKVAVGAIVTASVAAGATALPPAHHHHASRQAHVATARAAIIPPPGAAPPPRARRRGGAPPPAAPGPGARAGAAPPARRGPGPAAGAEGAGRPPRAGPPGAPPPAPRRSAPPGEAARAP